jgi:GrpB-like predicted nucleotidyltransferase (UPF0157 family)
MVPHDPEWQQLFQQEAEQITAVLGENAVAVHHIGSTAVPTIYAKPIIDVLLVVQDLFALDEKQSMMEALGYVALGEFGIPGRRYFRRDNDLGVRTHQVHAFENGSPQIQRHLAFRDYLISNPDTAQKYSDLKREMAAKYPNDSESCMDGKDELIKAIDSEISLAPKTDGMH